MRIVQDISIYQKLNLSNKNKKLTWNCKKISYNQDNKMKNGLLFITNRKQNGKNHNQWRIIFNHLSCKQLNLYGSKVGRWRICFALFKIYIQNKKRCIEKVRRISKINFISRKPQDEKKSICRNAEKNDIPKHYKRQRQMIDPCMIEFDLSFALIVWIRIFIFDF